MDMLYARYSSPMDLMRSYINRGRFGEFVDGFLKAEYSRKKAEADKDEEWHLWVAYIHSHSDKSFSDWKAAIMADVGSKKKNAGADNDLTADGIQSIMADLFPSTTEG